MMTAVALLALAAQDAKWLSDYNDALAQAAREGKPLVIDAGRAG
jgi:hypothetical protein